MNDLEIIPRHAPEVIEAIASRRYHGDDEKVPTTSIKELMVSGVRIISRYQKANELELMRAIVKALPGPHREAVQFVFCDSKPGYCFSVTLRNWNANLARVIGICFETTLLAAPPFGHNGISVTVVDADCGEYLELDPNWGDGA